MPGNTQGLRLGLGLVSGKTEDVYGWIRGYEPKAGGEICWREDEPVRIVW